MQARPKLGDILFLRGNEGSETLSVRYLEHSRVV